MTSFDRLKSFDIPAPTRALLGDVEACRVRHEKAIAAPTVWLEEHLGVRAAIDAVLSANRLEGVAVERSRAEDLAVGPAPRPQGEAERRLWNYREARLWVLWAGADAELSPDDLRGLAPFAAANERVAMLGAQLALLKAGIGVCRFVSLERLIESSPAAWREGRDLGAWLDYFAGLARRAYREFEEAAEPVRPAPGKPENPPPAGPPTMTARLVGYMDGVPGRFTKDDLRRACPEASVHLIESLLKRLKAEGRLRPVGRGKRAAWERTERWGPRGD